MKLHIWTEGRAQGTTVNPGKGDGLVSVKHGQVAVLIVVDPGDPALARLIRMADLLLTGEGEVVP